MQLIEELETVYDIDDLIDKVPRLRRIFNEQAELMIEARKWQLKHDTSWVSDNESSQLSLELEGELKRVYAIPAARELLEQCQFSALECIDAFEKKVKKKSIH